MADKQIAFGELGTDPFGSQKPKSAAQSIAGTVTTASTSTLHNPVTFPSDWDFCIVQGVRSPGVIPKKGISGLEREHEWDVKKGKGTKGATTTYVGRPPIKFSVKFLLWDDGTLGTGHDHFAEWDKFAAVHRFDPTKKAPAEAVSFYHPAAADDAIGVSAVVVTKIGAITEEDDNGLYSRTVEYLEYAPAPQTNATSTPGATKYTTGKDDPNGTPGDQPDPAIKKLQNQAKALADQAQSVA